MIDTEKKILESQLNKIYELLKKVPQSQIKGTPEFQIVYELETINMKLNISFND